jgi:L-seryl-tRNA(Ser) seleniumtransferase
VHSYAGGLWLALNALAADREVLISRAEVGQIDAAGPLPALAAAARAILRDVGTANRTLSADYESAISPRAALLLQVVSDDYRVVGETSATGLEDLVALARDRELMLASAVASAPLVEPPESIQWSQRSVRETMAAGVDLVLVRGDGLIGGPPCGILVGRADVIHRITANPLFAAWQLDAHRCAALVGTLQLFEGVSETHELLPVWQLLTVSLENLQNRAERIAPQLAAAPGVATAVAIATQSPIIAALGPGGGRPSYGVSLTSADGDVVSLERRLSVGRHSVIGRRENGAIVLDLRTVFPRQDRLMVESLVGGSATQESPPQVDTPSSAMN